MYVTAIIAAGGRGSRLGGPVPKQFISVGGRPILERSVSLFLEHPAVDALVVALPEGIAADPPAYLARASKPLQIVEGGARRRDSVANAFHATNPKSDLILVHDAARPFASASLIARTIAAAAESGAAVAAVRSRDTVKRAGSLDRTAADAEPGAGEYQVIETLARDAIFLAQTPQAFRRGVLADALQVDDDGTDEAALAERAGHRVRLVEGESTNIKITTAEDLLIADAIVRGGKAAPTGRAGIGYDVHRLVEGRRLVLGGVTIAFDRGLLGHSDADVVCHAIADAVLGAAAAGDIGRHFPDSDPRWRGASSLDLLRRAAELIRAEGLEVGNVDASVIAERPTLGPYVDRMRANIAGALGISPGRISIKAKTNEGIGELGRGEAIAVHAIALVRQTA